MNCLESLISQKSYHSIDCDFFLYDSSAKVNLTVSGDDFTIYSGPNVSHVRHLHKILQESWFTVLPWKTKTISVAPFNGSCTGVFTAQDYTIQLDLRQLNLNRLLVFAAGLVLFFVAPALCRKVVFHYTTGTLVGVLGSVLIALYLLSRLVPKKGGALAVLAGGGSLVLFALRQLWDNCYSVLRRYHYYVAAYLAVSSAVSFAVCYRWGPLTDGRSLQLLQWTLQALGLALVFLSSDHQEAVSGVVVAVVCLHNFPTSWTYRLVTCWSSFTPFPARRREPWTDFLCVFFFFRRQRFPPKVQLLTESEYLDQGRLETKKALDELRTFCRSPQCNAWRTVGRLQQPLRYDAAASDSSADRCRRRRRRRPFVEFVATAAETGTRVDRSSRYVQSVSIESHSQRSSSLALALFGTVEFGYIIHGIYHPAAYLGHFRPEPNFYIIKPLDILSSLPVIPATLRGARGNICALRAAKIALIAGVAA